MGASLVAFAAFAALLTITPGLDTVLVVRTAAVGGRAAGMAAGGGVAVGCLCWAAASGLGITALLTASTVAYTVLRWVGAAYLCMLGVRTLWRARRPTTAEPAPLPAPAGPARAFRTGLLTNLLNPKVGLFYLAVLPQFLPRGVATLPASLALGAVHVVEGLAWFALLVLVVGRLAARLGRPDVRRWLDRVTGVVFVAFAARLALVRTAR